MAVRFLAALSSVALLGAAPGPAGQQATLAGSATGRQLSFDRVPFYLVAEAIMRRVSDRPFLLCDRALQDKRLISIRLEPYQLRFSVVAQAFAAYGYSLRDVGGVFHVCGSEDRVSSSPQSGAGGADVAGPVGVPARPVRPLAGGVGGDGGASGMLDGRGSNLPLGSPLDGSMAQQAAVYAPQSPGNGPSRAVSTFQALEGYRPDFVPPAALKEALAAILPEVSLAVVDSPGQRPVLFARGSPELVDQFRKMVAYLDLPPDAVEVQAIVAEVTDTGRAGFGVSVVLDALRAGVGINLGTGLAAANSLSFHSGSFDAVLSAVASSNNVRIVSSPRLRGRAGETLRLQVGSDVPTLGAVVENPLGSTQQSVQYRSSGVIFEVTPRVYGKRIAIDVHQEVSAFAATETGVRNSPTLTKRSIDTKADLESGEWVVLGGLRSTEDTVARQGLFGIPLGREKVRRQTELVVLLNVRRAGQVVASLSPQAGKARPDGDARN